MSLPPLFHLRFLQFPNYIASFITKVLVLYSSTVFNCHDSIDFTICNPPFYSSAEELVNCAALKSRPPHSACTGSEIEMATPGGEVAFVGRIIEESCTLKDRVQWYSSMLGKFSSISSVIEQLKGKRVNNWAVKEFIQGGKTRRWGVAWSWEDMRPKMVGCFTLFYARPARS